jgi:hypothetical protein
MIEIRNPKQNRFGHLILEFGIYLGFEICNLEFQNTKPVFFERG